MERAVSINDFPNELLILIFKRLYKLHRERSTTSVSFSYKQEESDEDISSPNPKKDWLANSDPFDPSMFPYALAKVCRRWCTLLADFPAFWTRIPITIGSAATPLPTVANYFRYSKDSPIQVFVKRHPDDHNVQDLDEKSRVAALLPYISENLHRVKGLKLSPLHHASLPDIVPWLAGKANILESVILSHREDRVAQAVQAAPLGKDDTGHQVGDQVERLRLELSAPALTSLTIDAENFARASHSSGEWLAGLPKLLCLTLTPSGPSSPTQNLSITATIRALSNARNLDSLCIRGIHFLDDYIPSDNPGDLSEISSIGLVFEDLQGTDVATFVHAAGHSIDDLRIKNCSLLQLKSFFTGELRLYNFDEERNPTMAIPFSDIDTFEVHFYACSALNDAFLNFMADGGSSGDNFPAKTMCSLHLHSCTNFSVENLYNMVFARRHAIESNPTWDGTPVDTVSWNFDWDPDETQLRAITALFVWYGPPLPKEYRAKFTKLVSTFVWTDAVGVEDQAC